MKNKKWLILLIIAFPSFFWLILETSTINSRKLPYYGPKKLDVNKDTVFYSVGDHFYNIENGSVVALTKLERKDFPLYAIVFISEKYRDDSYRLTGLWEYLKYKKEKINHIPFILVTPNESGVSKPFQELKKLSESKNVKFYSWPKPSYDSLINVYFKEKPYYVDYSFFMLIDGERHIRGFYDARYVSEMKRLIGEYQHLRLKEEKQLLIEENEIKSES